MTSHERTAERNLTVHKIKARIVHECAVAGCSRPIIKHVIHGNGDRTPTIYAWCGEHDPSPGTGYQLPGFNELMKMEY